MIEQTTREQLSPVIDRLDVLATVAGTAPAIPAEHYGCIRDIITGLADQVDGAQKIADNCFTVMKAQTDLYRQLLLCCGVVILFLLVTVVMG
jgi:hypothetical protein